MQSKAPTVEQYLAELPEERRAVLDAVRAVVLANLDEAYEEGMQYGMIGYYVPHAVYPAGYHCDARQPLPFAGLAAQKNHFSLYLMCVYGDGDNPHATWFREAWAATGKKLDMGKSCVRFRKLDDLALDVIGEAIRRVPARRWIEIYESARSAQAREPRKKPAGSRSSKSPKRKVRTQPKAARKKTTAKAAARDRSDS